MNITESTRVEDLRFINRRLEYLPYSTNSETIKELHNWYLNNGFTRGLLSLRKIGVVSAVDIEKIFSQCGLEVVHNIKQTRESKQMNSDSSAFLRERVKTRRLICYLIDNEILNRTEIGDLINLSRSRVNAIYHREKRREKVING